MDGPNLEHSDSDSGESWTLLEQSPSYADDAPDFTSPTTVGYAADNIGNDDDTDGISIISDSDNEQALLIEHQEVESGEQARPAELHKSNILDEHISTYRKNSYNESMRNTDVILGDSNGKLKTYVHRRNKRLSTVLNIIMLGSVITAAGVAIGHMWGARNDCSLQTTPSVNKILSNLYKLQEENAYLRSKLKELAALNAVHKKSALHKITPKRARCKKVFEESLSNKKTENFLKCLDTAEPKLDKPLTVPDYEREFVNDLNKLKSVYEQNKSWLDDEIAWRIKHEKRLRNKAKLTKIPEEKRSNIHENYNMHDEIQNKKPKSDDEASPESDSGDSMYQEMNIEITPAKITYADSLKLNNIHKEETYETQNIKDFELRPKRKVKKQLEVISENSDMELKKDDRYNKDKHKHEKKKTDRQKSYKKQKRRNKYEQWEMKGGFMKDYDDISIPSLKDNEYIMKNVDKNVAAREYEKDNYINQLINDEKEAKTETQKQAKMKVKDLDWFEKRATSRKEARKLLEKELFGDSTPNNSAWYFRRMARREVCRVKADNTTHKKLTKRSMNFKSKH